MLAGAAQKINKRLKKDKDLREIAKGGSISFIVNLLGIAFGYVFVFVISKIYGDSSASIYGRYVLVTLILRVGSILSRSGMDTAMLKYTAAFASTNLWGNIKVFHRKFFFLITILSLVTGLVIVVFASFWSKVLQLPNHLIFIGGFFVFPLAIGLYYSQGLRGLKKIGISSFLRTSAVPTFNFLLLPLFLLIIDKRSVLFEDLPSYTFFGAILLTTILGYINWTRSLSVRNDNNLQFSGDRYKSSKELFKNSYPFLLVESMTFIGTWIDQLILGIKGTNEDVGIFNVCVKFAMITSLSLQAVNTISAPKFSEYFFRRDFKTLGKNFRSTTKIIFWSTAPIVIVLICFPSFFLSLFGKSFTHGSLALVLLSIGALINVMTGSVGTLLQMTGHQKTIQHVLLISVAIETILNFVLIPEFGVTGASIASLVGTAISNLAMSFFVKKYFGFNSIYPFR